MTGSRTAFCQFSLLLSLSVRPGQYYLCCAVHGFFGNAFNARSASIAACIVEPMVQAAVGMRVYPAKVLTRISELCKIHDVLLIAD